MKTKIMTKKLKLNKRTIVQLDEKQLNEIKGGEITMSCNTVCIIPDSLCICTTYFRDCY